MPAKQRNLSPAKQREVEAKVAQKVETSEPKTPAWASWETKVDRLEGRNLDNIVHGWMAHVPEISPPGTPPREGIGAITTIDELMPDVPKSGDLTEEISGAREVVLHEAYYLAHKAVHVQISCAKSVMDGLHTWAVVDAYQASLFALSSIMCFFGITVERCENDFILIDVWPDSIRPTHRKSTTGRNAEIYKFIRFKTLDHFHKWAILKRILRTVESPSPLINFLREAIVHLDDKTFATHRNSVHYQSTGWIAEDLLIADQHGPIEPAKTSQELFEEIYDSSASGTVYLMCALIELACEFADKFASSGVLTAEKKLLDRRLPARSFLAPFDWTTVNRSA